MSAVLFFQFVFSFVFVILLGSLILWVCMYSLRGGLIGLLSDLFKDTRVFLLGQGSPISCIGSGLRLRCFG